MYCENYKRVPDIEKVRDGISPEDAVTEQEERLAERDEIMSGIHSCLHEMYGKKYRHEDLETAAHTVSSTLNKTLPMRISTRELLEKSVENQTTKQNQTAGTRAVNFNE